MFFADFTLFWINLRTLGAVWTDGLAKATKFAIYKFVANKREFKNNQIIVKKSFNANFDLGGFGDVLT